MTAGPYPYAADPVQTPGAQTPGIYRAPVVAPPFAPLGSGLRIAFSIVIAVSITLFFSTLGLWTAGIIVNPERPSQPLLLAGASTLAGSILLLYAQIFIGIFWIYRVWKWLPPDQRWSRHWKGWISPDMAAGMMLIPYFHYYWMFVIDCGICDALDRMRVNYTTTREAPKSLAIAAAICQLVVPMPVGAVLWLMYMSRVEKLTHEMSASAARTAQAGFVG